MAPEPRRDRSNRALLRTPVRRWVVSAPRPPRQRHTRALMQVQLGWIVGWTLVLAVPTWVFYRARPAAWKRGDGWLTQMDVQTTAEMVPAIVIAIFVFAVGVAFVIAQVVPPARGTRAVETLRGRRLKRSVTPAPALILGSVVLAFGPPFDEELAVALLVGSVSYTAISLIYMLSILIDATDPAEFKALLRVSAMRSIQSAAGAATRLPQCACDGMTWSTFPPPRDPVEDVRRLRDRGVPETEIEEAGAARRLQAATDNLYETIRTLRGWARVAARANDSRELQESLEGILELAQRYMGGVLVCAGRLTAVPSIYWSHADDSDVERRLNPLNPPSGMCRPSATKGLPPSEETRTWVPWEPPALVRRSSSGTRPGDEVRALPCTWFANEVGRAVVRAVELALESNTLLDRDTARLLNTLTNVAEMSCRLAVDTKGQPDGVPEQWAFQWNAGIMTRYLVEVGLGVRHCPSERIEWYFEPCARLICLQQEFMVRGQGTAQGRALAIGAAAGAALVAEALVTAKADAGAGATAGSITTATSDVVVKLTRAAGGLLLANGDVVEELRLINEGRLEPRERVATYRTDSDVCATLLHSLAVTRTARTADRGSSDEA